MMKMLSDDAVLIEKGKKAREPYVITVNCPDKTGLGCDICHTVLEFELYVTKGDVTQVLDELELTIQRLKVTTTPDGCVLDLFFIKDNLELLHTKQRQDETCEHLYNILGESCISCELQLAGPQYDNLHCISSLSPTVAEELFRLKPSGKETFSQARCSYITELKRASVKTDTYLSPAHTVLQINCVDHKGFLYNIMRTLKDSKINGHRELDLFTQQKDGKKIVDPEKQDALCSHLKLELLHPLRVLITNHGPDTQLLVANPVEQSGRGRPRVFYGVTFALKSLGICIFSAEIGRHSAENCEWEVYRFLLDENSNFQLSSMVIRNQNVDKVVRTLMG